MPFTKDGFHKQVDSKIGDDKYALLGAGGHKEWSTASTANTLVARDANKDINIRYAYASLFNSSSGAISNSDVISRVYISYDNYIRWATLENFGAQLRDSGYADGRWVLKSGDTMTGALKRYYGTASDDPMIALTSNDLDVWLWRINHGSSAITSTFGVYGFGLKYLGSLDGNNNKLVLYSDAQNGTQVAAMTMQQDGKITLAVSPTAPGFIKTSSDDTYVLLGGGGHKKESALSVANADTVDSEHAYQLRAFPKNNSSILFSSLPFLENNISMFGKTPVVSMDNAPEGLCYGPISSYTSYTSDYIAVQPNEILYGEIDVYRASGATGTAGTLYYGALCYDRNKKQINSNNGAVYFVISGGTISTDGAWHKYSATYTVPTSHTAYNGSDGKGVYYIKVYVLVNYSKGTIPTYVGRVLLKRLNSSGQNGYIGTTTVQTLSSPNQNITGVGNITPNIDNDYNLGSNNQSTPLFWKSTYTRIINGALTNGTVTQASDGGSSASPNRYKPMKWTFNAGITPVNGDTITIKTLAAGHDYGVFLSTNNGANYYPITLSGTGRMTSHFPAGTYLTLLFDSSNSAASMFALAGSDSRVTISNGTWRVINYYDSGNPGDWNLRQYTIKAADAINSSHIIGGTDAGYKNIDSTNMTFDIRYPVLWAGGNIASGSTGTNNYIHYYAVNIRNSSNSNISGLTSYKNVYIKGTIYGTIFSVISGGNPYVQDITTTDDGYVYYYIGRAYSSNAITFDGTGKDIYIYKNGAIRRWADYSTYSDNADNADTIDGYDSDDLLIEIIDLRNYS